MAARRRHQDYHIDPGEHYDEPDFVGGGQLTAGRN